MLRILLKKKVERVVRGVERLCGEAPGSQIVINLPLDGVGEQHEQIRGVRGNYAKLIETYEGLRKLNAPNLTIGMHTVIPRLNVDHFMPLYRQVRGKLKPDSFITELAEERIELDMIGLDLTAPVEVGPGCRSAGGRYRRRNHGWHSRERASLP